MAEDFSFYSQQAQNPAVRKLLQTIRFAEGTAGPKGYQTQFGGGTFNDLSRHPDRAISSGGYTSTAAGAYQFLTPTWQSVASKLGLKGFGPKEQDIAATYLAHQRLKPVGGFAALEKQGLSPQVASALAPEWASFPTESGKSFYGQPVKNLQELQKQFGQAQSQTVPQQLQQSQQVQPQQRFAGNTVYNIYYPDAGYEQGDYYRERSSPGLEFLKMFQPKVTPIQGIAEALNANPRYIDAPGVYIDPLVR